MAQPILLSGPAGAAFHLRTPSNQAITIKHAMGTVQVRPGANMLLVLLNAPAPIATLRDDCWRVAQEALDLWCAVYRQAFATQLGEHEYLLWRQTSAGYETTIVDLMAGRWDMRAAGLTGGPAAPPMALPAHNPAMRFFRLSLLTDDLFDAFRNAYLALEYLVSEISAKAPGEREKAWLKRVLDAASLRLSAVLGRPLADFVDDVYIYTRLPLFHAKAGQTVYLPSGTDRAKVQKSFAEIQRVLASIMHLRLSPLIPSGWGSLSREVVDRMARVVFSAIDEIAFADATGRQEIVRTHTETVDSPRRFEKSVVPHAHAATALPERNQQFGLSSGRGRLADSNVRRPFVAQ